MILIEDDLQIQELIEDFLANYDFEVYCFANPIEAITSIKNKKDFYHIVILDLMLPHIDGFDVCQRIREISNIPIIISSAKKELADKILGFEKGADDYLAKPYEPKELVIRINAILRRIENKSTKIICDFEINENKMEISLNGYTIDLTKIEYEILKYILLNKDKVLSREMIAYATSIEYDTKDRTIDVHISNIRQKIGDTSKNSKYIKSIWGVGYKLICQ